MAEKFDVIIIGAGHNGLICANYLARCGLKTLVFEKRLEAGGGLTAPNAAAPSSLRSPTSG